MNQSSVKSLITDLLIIAFLLLFPHYVPLPFYSYALVCVAVIWFYQRRKKADFGEFGLSLKLLSFRAVVTGLISALIWVAFMKWVYIPFIFHFFPQYVKPYTEYDFVRNNVKTLLLIISAAILIGGLYEEIVFRGFILKRLTVHFKGARYPFLLAAAVSSILFAFYHWQQGIFGMVPAFLGSLYWSLIFRKSGSNLWYPVFSHALYDTITLVMIYFGVFGK
jgi:membrane protease YdiL (CAAX protease family)